MHKCAELVLNRTYFTALVRLNVDNRFVQQASLIRIANRHPLKVLSLQTYSPGGKFNALALILKIYKTEFYFLKFNFHSLLLELRG